MPCKHWWSIMSFTFHFVEHQKTQGPKLSLLHMWGWIPEQLPQHHFYILKGGRHWIYNLFRKKNGFWFFYIPFPVCEIGPIFSPWDPSAVLTQTEHNMSMTYAWVKRAKLRAYGEIKNKIKLPYLYLVSIFCSPHSWYTSSGSTVLKFLFLN